MANLTPPIPIKSGMQVTLPNSQCFAHNFIAKAPAMQTTSHLPVHLDHTLLFQKQLRLQPPPNDTHWSFTTRLFPPLQFLWKLLENSQRYTQSSASPPPHHPKFTLIAHCHLGNNHCTATIHRQRQAIPHHQAIASTPIRAEIA